MSFKSMDKAEHLKVSAKGGKNKQTKDFSYIVNKNMTTKELNELYKGLVKSASKGNVKAIEILLKYYKPKEQESSLEKFINEYD